MWPFLESVLNPSVPLKDKATYFGLVNQVHKLRFEKESDLKMLKDKIQELINSPLTRFEGFLIMDALMANHPTTYIHNWGLAIQASLKCSDTYASKQLTLRILRQVVVNFSGVSSCAEAFHRFIPEILPMLLNIEQNDEGFLYCCQTLAVCMKHIPVILGPHFDEIELFLMKHVDSISTETIEAIADCFAALPFCLLHFQKPKPLYSKVWLEIYMKTLSTLQSLLNDILKFPGVDNFSINLDGVSLFSLPSDDNTEEFSYIFSRNRIFSTLCRCLAKMMSARFSSIPCSSRVEVPVHDVLNCLQRVFQVKEIVRIDQQPKFSMFLVAYPLIQNAALSVLESLIVNFEVVEQSGNFAKLLKESIDATTLTSLTPSSLRQVRSTSWKVLNIWLKQYASKASCDIVNDRFLIQELLKEIAIDPKNVEFTVDTYREESCIEALRVLKNMFTNGGSLMDKALIEEISTTVLKTLRKIQLHLHPAKTFPYPYTNAKCRVKLYDILLTCSICGTRSETKVINQAINIFRLAMKDSNLEVNTLCHQAFMLFRYYINPRKPLPESLTNLNMGRALPLPHEEDVRTGWEMVNWNVNNESSEGEGAMEVAPPCHIENSYHNPVENDSQRDLLPIQNIQSPIHYSDEHESQGQCNGSNGRLESNKHPSHSDNCDESESDEIEEYKEYCEENTHSMLPIDILPIRSAQTPLISSIDTPIVINEVKGAVDEPKVLELTPVERAIHESVATTNHHDSNAAEVLMNSVDDVTDLKTPPVQIPQRMAENGMDVMSEYDDSGEEDDEEEEDEEEDIDYIRGDRLSPECYNERPLKRQKISDDDRSSDEYEEKSSNQNQEMMNQDEESEEENEVPDRSPTIQEMCNDFVLAEPEEIS